MLTIQTTGRFGNNVVQFINAIYIAKQKSTPCIKYSFLQFNNSRLDLPTNNINRIKISDSFFNSDISLSFEEKQQIALQYLLPILKYSKTVTGFEAHYSNALFVHIRSGDIFQENPHPGYTQPPS